MQGNSCPCFILALFALVVSCVWANSRWAKLFASAEGGKLHRVKITKYTVCIHEEYTLHVIVLVLSRAYTE